MKFQPVREILKNGECIIIREATKKDASALLQAITRYLIDSPYLLTDIEEFNPTIQQEAKWIQSLCDNRNCIILVAIHHNKIIGNIDVKAEPRLKTRHNALVGLGILKEWQGEGLGAALLGCALAWVKENSTLEALWLHVFATNKPAIALYEKMGFQLSAIQPKYIKNKDGSYTDNLVMRLNLAP